MASGRGMLLLIVGLAAVLSVSCSATGLNPVRSAGQTSSREFDVSNFTELAYDTIGTVYIEVGEKESLRLDAETNLLPLFRAEVVDGRLRIRTRACTIIRPGAPVTFHLTVRSLDTIHVRGSGEVHAPDLVDDGIAHDEIELKISGSGKLFAGELRGTSVDLTINGSGDIETGAITTADQTVRIRGSGRVMMASLEAERLELNLPGSGKLRVAEGSVGSQTITVRGSGDYEAFGVLSDAAEVKISGSGDAEITANEELLATVSGSGGIQYRGNPTVQSKISGSGHITPVGD